MVAESLIISSQITGFISFAITILTLLGVYRDLISTLRSADVHIPIILANLRQEILFEKAFISRNLKYVDEFHVFSRRLCYVKQPNGHKERTKRAFSMLMDATIKDLWIQFKTLERPFLIRNPMRAEEVRKGDYWDEKDLEEQPKTGSRRRGKKQVRNAEDDIRERGKQFYRTDLAHRWIWWQSKGDVDNLMNQVQRVQMRRMERDLFETDELVKRLVRRDGVGSEFGSRSGSSSSSDGGGPRRRNVAGVGVVRSRAGSRATSRAGSVRSVRMPSTRRTTAGRTVREVEERESVTRPAASSPPIRQSEMEASNTGRRRERRAESRVEYEVLRPASVYGDVADRPRRTSTYEEDRPGAGRRRSYSRERETRDR